MIETIFGFSLAEVCPEITEEGFPSFIFFHRGDVTVRSNPTCSSWWKTCCQLLVGFSKSSALLSFGKKTATNGISWQSESEDCPRSSLLRRGRRAACSLSVMLSQPIPVWFNIFKEICCSEWDLLPPLILI